MYGENGVGANMVVQQRQESEKGVEEERKEIDIQPHPAVVPFNCSAIVVPLPATASHNCRHLPHYALHGHHYSDYANTA